MAPEKQLQTLIALLARRYAWLAAKALSNFKFGKNKQSIIKLMAKCSWTR